MERSKHKIGSDPGSKIRHVLETMTGDPHKPRPAKVTPADIGSRPVAEDQPVARQIHLFGPSQLDRAIFCRQLATMIEVGIPLLKALKMLAVRTPNPTLARAIEAVAKSVEAGNSVSQAFGEHVSVFTPLVCNIVRVGEIGGILEDSLVRLAQIIETKADIKRKVKSALMYPAVAVTVAIGVIILIMLKAVPVFKEVYGSVENLPGPTAFIVKASDLLVGTLAIWIPLMVIAIGAGLYFIRTPKGHYVISWISIKTPVLRTITRKIAVARFSRTLGGLLTAGVPLIESLSIAADTNENEVIAEKLRDVQKTVEKGEKVSRPLAEARVFPEMVVDMIAIGEDTGTLDRMLEKTADVYDADVDSTLRGLSTIIEPLLIVLLGGAVIFIALAVMLPYFSLVDQI